MQHCSSCETELPHNAHFCGYCGCKLEATTTIDGMKNIESPPVHTEPLNVSTANPRTSPFSEKVLSKLPMPAQQVITSMLIRAYDPGAEVFAERLQTEESQTRAQAWLPLLTLISTLGVLCVAHAYVSARLSLPGAEFFLWLGLLLIFVPATVRLLSPAASHFERLCLLCVVNICLYLVKVMDSPLNFTYYDEFLHWLTADDIARSGHLFGENSLLPSSPFYPGLEIVTNSISKLSGLSTFTAGIIVIGVAHFMLILSLFGLYELITKSARIAGIATILYMANPQFILFDAQFAYESLALPLATFMLYAMARQEMRSLPLVRLKQRATYKVFAMVGYKNLNYEQGWIMLTIWITLGAIVITHHMTDFVFDGFLILWTAIYTLQHPAALRYSNVAKTALFGVLISLVWINLHGNPIVSYFSSYFAYTASELAHILTGTSSVRHLFVSYTGQTDPLWQRVTMLLSVILISLGLPFGLLCLWQRYRHNALACLFGILSLFYPITLIFRFTNFGSDISYRSTAFLFIAIAYVLAIFIVQFWPIRRLNWKWTSLITIVISVVFLGGTSLGSGTVWDVLPGPYLVTADARSIEPEGIQASVWTYSHLGPNNRIETDRINQILMSTYGEQRVVTYLEDNVDVTPIFFSPSLSTYDISILRSTRARYLVVDLRLSTALPLLGFYFEPGESGSFQYITPINRADLTKFSTVAGINRVFDSGDIVIYDVGPLINGP